MDKEPVVLLPLSDLGINETCHIVKFGQVEESDIRKLKDLGVMHGMPIRVREKTVSGPVVIAVNDASIAIAQHVAEQIFVLLKDTQR